VNSWDEVDLDDASTELVSEEDPGYHVHEVGDNPNWWNYTCNMHLGSEFPVKPPWVPWWVVMDCCLMCLAVPDQGF